MSDTPDVFVIGTIKMLAQLGQTEKIVELCNEWFDKFEARKDNKMDLKVFRVHYEKISAFDMLADITKIFGVASIQAAFDEIAAQQSVQPTAFGEGGNEHLAEYNQIREQAGLPKLGGG